MVLGKITACGNSPRLYPSPNDQNLQCSCSVRVERILSMGGSEKFFYLWEDQEQFFPNVNIVFYKKNFLSQNLRED